MSSELDWTLACNSSNHGEGLNGNDSIHADNEVYEIYFTYIYRVIYAVGLAGNMFALIVWTRSGLRSSPVTYFQAICIGDSLVLIMHPLETVNAVHVSGACQLTHVLFLAVQIFTIFLVLGLTVERYVELCHPLAAEMMITRRRTICSILVLAALSVIASACEAYIWQVDPQLATCTLRRTTSQRFMWTYAILVLAILFLCPLVLVVVLNVLVARRIKRRRRNSYAYSVKMVPDRHNMNLPVMFISLYLAVCEIVYATVHISQYFVRTSSNDKCMQWIRSGIRSDMPLTGRWHSYYEESLPLLILDAISLTSYAVDLTIFTLCSKTFRRNIRELFRRYKRRKSLIMGYREPIPY